MSNCIELHSYLVAFTPEEFDIPAFEALRKEHANHRKERGMLDLLTKKPEELAKLKSIPIEDIFCWYLRDNSHVNEYGYLEIALGKGLSSHTWRDFRITLWFLNQFVRKPKSFTLTASDEYDGHNTLFPIKVNLPYASWEVLLKEV